MKRLFQYIVLLLIVFLFSFNFSQRIFAACGGGVGECTNTPCQKLMTGCASYVDTPATQYKPATHTCVSYFNYYETATCCTYYQSGGGSCSCCVNGDDTCYFGCSGPPTTGNPEPTVAPGDTPTNTPTPILFTPSPTPQPGTVRARAVLVPNGTSACSTVQASTSYIPVGITLFGEGVTHATTVDGAYVTWANALAGTKSFVDAPPTDYILALACWDTDLPAAQGSAYTATLSPGSTLTWQLGYTAGAGWVQAQGGDVYSATSLRSYIPSLATSGRYFDTNGAGGTPGVVTYGTTFDFDGASTVADGATYVSTTNWLANEVHPATDYYAIMFHRFGSPTVADSTTALWTNKPVAAPVNDGGAYYINGDLTIDSTDWTVGTGESIVVLVSGKLTINKKINITGRGFVAFIVNGDILVDSSVGTTSVLSNPVVEGIYITSPNGTFHTGLSTTAAARKFVGKGTFVAGNFALERDLDADTRNITYPADLFIYNPELLIRMPEKMKDLPVSWQEVAP